MKTAVQQLRDDAAAAAARLLSESARFAELHAPKPLFRKTMKRRGASPVLVELTWPGVLRVYDPVTAVLLAESVPGCPAVLLPLEV